MSYNFPVSLIVLPKLSKSSITPKSSKDQKPAVYHGMTERLLIFRSYSPSRKVRVSVSGYYFKLNGEVPLIRNTLEDNGLKEHKTDWTILWGNGYMKTNIYVGISRWQKINHFPRSSEISKKDLLFKNLAKMQSLYGLQHFNFVPETYVLPADTRELEEKMMLNPEIIWIVKPPGKSQGKGIFLTNDPNELPVGQSYVACRYIDNPMLIGGLKFDLRIYVAVTCIDPLRIYIYKEGLVRFATSSYNTDQLSNRYAHLTNYSVNKNNPDFDASTEDGKGHKWTLTAFKKYCEENKINFSFIWQKIKEIVIKTIISAESKIYAGYKMHVPYRNNCFELLGFDILIDDNFAPWLLEVNLSPSLNTDSNIDLKVKSKLISELFTMVGFSSKVSMNEKKSKKIKPEWNSSTLTQPDLEISKEELRIIQETKAEFKRCGGFERIFPGEYSFLYSRFFEEQRPMNLIVCGEFEKAKRTPSRSTDKGFKGNAYRTKLIPVDARRKPNSAIYLKLGEEGLYKLFR